MHQLKKIIIALFLLFTATFGKAQIAETNIEEIIESIVENLDEEINSAILIEDLEFFAENPINMNNTNEIELSRLHLLNDIQIQKLLQYISDFGQAYSVYELNTIENLTPDILTQMAPFIWFGPPGQTNEKFLESLKYANQELIVRTLETVQKQQGYKKKDDGTVPFDGNRFRYYTRYRLQANDKLTIGFTAEKDPGEAFFKNAQKNGFDFYSGHVSFKVNQIIQNITLGDFIVRSGQGLVLWQGYSMGKSASTVNILKTNQGVRPYTSTDENRFFRGVATSLKFRKASVSLFYSQQKNDANIESNEFGEPIFTSLQTSGYHRTENEIMDKNSVQNKNTGGFANWHFTHLKLGTTFQYQEFNMPFIRKEQLYNTFQFSGQNNYVLSTDYLFSKGKYQLFGEAAVSKSKGIAVLQGLIAHLDERFIYTMQFRQFDKKYHALWGNAFSERTEPNNESGVYFGTQVIPFRKMTMKAYVDFYDFKWLNYNTVAPSNGYDLFFQSDYNFSRKINFYFRFKNEKKSEKIVEGVKYVNEPEQIKKTRFQLNYNCTETIKLKSRIENCIYSGYEKEKGFVFIQDFQYSPANIPINISLRAAYFNTEGYNSRIYAYENDLLYSFSIPAYYGTGFRTYLNLKYKISNKIDLWFKLSNTAWTDRNTISSGYNQINGNNKTELKFQLRLKF